MEKPPNVNCEFTVYLDFVCLFGMFENATCFYFLHKSFKKQETL